jgi:hypothetical protein
MIFKSKKIRKGCIMSTLITNAAPMFIPLGTKDDSIEKVTPRTIGVPSHLAKTYIFAEKGPVLDRTGLPVKELVDYAKLVKLYGYKTVDPTSPYYTHATKFMTEIMKQGSVVLVQRVLPKDVDELANVTIYLDVLKTKVPLYKRNSDGVLRTIAMVIQSKMTIHLLMDIK